MDLGIFEKIAKELAENKAINCFLDDLSNHLKKGELNKEIKEYTNQIENIKNTEKLNEDKTYVVSNIEDNSINVVDIENGKEIKVYISTDEKNMDRAYTMDKNEFLNLNLTDNIIMKDNRLYSNSEPIEIKNDKAYELLADLYMEEKESEGMQYEVIEIKDDKIFLTNADGSGGYFSIHKELYPDFEVGDIVQRNNKRYNKL